MADKLSRLLETETELDDMLERTRQEAAQLTARARAEAEERVRRFEIELDTEDRALRGQVAFERDETIATVRAEARRVVERLDSLDEESVAELAQYVVGRLVGASGGRP